MEDERRRAEKTTLKANEALAEAITKRVAAGNYQAALALKRLVNWKPECGFPENITPVYHQFEEKLTVEEYREAQELNGEIPFATEAYTYQLWGKEDARTYLALLGSLARALGFEELALHDPFFREDGNGDDGSVVG
jgi:hypothetical protein